MRGRVSDWKDDRGFGFIEPESGGERVFFHISGVARGAPRPCTGDVVAYELAPSAKGGQQAVRVGPVGLAAPATRARARRLVLSCCALAVLAALWWLVRAGQAPLPVLLVFAGASTTTFIVYGLDKLAARRGARRTPENTLHFFALLGGWPGALLAQQVFRHKSAKPSFQLAFWTVVVLNCGLLAFLLSPKGAAMLRELLARV